MPSSNILLFDANKANMMSDEQYNTNTQRLNGVQSGIASSQLQNKTLYQVSLVAYAIAQIMNQNGFDANDTAAVSAFVANLSGTMLQKVVDLASTQEAQAGVATGKWMSPALVKTAIDTLAAKAQNILSSETKTAYGLGSDAVPDDVFEVLSNAALYKDGKFVFPSGEDIPYVSIETGSYVGTGTSGESHPNTLTFDLNPQMVIVAEKFEFNSGFYDLDSILFMNPIDCGSGGYTTYSTKFSLTANEISWYSSGSYSNLPFIQKNKSGTTYYYVAIGLSGGAA